MNKNQNGFSIVEILIVLVTLGLIGFVGFSFLNSRDTDMTPKKEAEVAQASSTKMKHLGVNLDYYNPATGMAGDFKFTKAALHDNVLFMNYGHTIAASSVSAEKQNPQPSFILPLGTKVRSLVDGKVIAVQKLYSNDFSIMVQPEGSDLIFETEHVINVAVKEGDVVKAGDAMAEVSPHDSQHNDGLGLVEIGILKPGNPPSHICPFDYLDDSIKDETLKKITALQKSWEDYRGDANIYDESTVLIPGCVSRDPIEG